MEDGAFVGSQGIVRDVTERREADIRLNEMETQLAHVSRLSTIGEMMAGIGHEMNQPLYAIRNYACATQNLLEAEAPSDLNKLRKWNAAISNAADRAGAMFKRLRTFVRREESVHHLCDMNEIVRESTQLVTFEARRHGASIRLKLPDTATVVDVDKVQIQQVLVNLLRNAFEAMDEPDIEVREATIRVKPSGESTEVSVADTGPGLSSHGDVDIFEAFATTKPQGLGMGLAISSTVLEANDGKIWAEPGRDRGTIFRFTLPTSQGESTDVG